MYSKAPQYPWPCPLQDVLAACEHLCISWRSLYQLSILADMYLINPPASALHKPVDPSKIVFAGDSAGAALCLTTLTILRDMGLPLPAGAVLISPWVDLTHSFPSVMANSETVSLPHASRRDRMVEMYFYFRILYRNTGFWQSPRRCGRLTFYPQPVVE